MKDRIHDTPDEEEEIKQRLFSVADDKTMDWVQKKSQAFLKLMSYYKCAMMEVETKLHVLREEYALEHDHDPIHSIKTRLKSLPSVKAKLERLELPMSLTSIEESLHDVAGIRVVCPFRDDVYMLADALLGQDDITLITKKDYIANPKPNGYRSLHLIVAIPIFLASEKRIMQVEIQLRTVAMDFWASLEHQLLYKKEISQRDTVEAELYECAQLSAQLDARMNELRKSIDEHNDIQEKGSTDE